MLCVRVNFNPNIAILLVCGARFDCSLTQVTLLRFESIYQFRYLTQVITPIVLAGSYNSVAVFMEQLCSKSEQSEKI